MGRKWTQTETDLLKGMCKVGFSSSEIGAALHRSRSAIANRGHVLGLRLPERTRKETAVLLAVLREVLRECSRVQMNTTTEHQMHEPAPNAQQIEQDDTKSP